MYTCIYIHTHTNLLSCLILATAELVNFAGADFEEFESCLVRECRSVKRDLLQCQKRPTTVSKETCLVRECRSTPILGRHSFVSH